MENVKLSYMESGKLSDIESGKLSYMESVKLFSTYSSNAFNSIVGFLGLSQGIESTVTFPYAPNIFKN